MLKGDDFMLKYGEKIEWPVVREHLEREKILLIHHSKLKYVKKHDHFFLELT